PQLRAEVHKPAWLSQIVIGWLFRPHAKAVAIRQTTGIVLRNTWAGTTRLRLGRIRPKRNKIESAQPDSNVDGISAGADPGNDLAQDARTVVEATSVWARASVGAEKFVQQIAMTMLDVDEIRSRSASDGRGAHVTNNQLANLFVCEYLVLAG